MKRSSSVTYIIATLILIFAACIGPAKAIGAAPKAGSAQVAETKPAVPSSYKYSPFGKPDPFKPFVDQELAVKKKKEEAKPLPLSPLQRESIEQFKLVGISGDEKNRRAVVQDARGKVYPISTGMYIGLNNGRIVAILGDRMIIEEQMKTPAGKKTKPNRITINLRREEGEGKP
jgi:type IV pilus assembly protein PilP